MSSMSLLESVEADRLEISSSRAHGTISRLRRHQAVFGALQSIPSPALTEVALWCGFDFIILDLEHGVLDEPSLLASLQVISHTPAFAVVRVRPRDFGAVGRYLDFGADGILLPDVCSAGEAQLFVAAANHNQRGARTAGGSARAARYGLGSRVNSGSPLLLAMIESADAVSEIDAIATTPGLDGVVIGPHDLAADLGTENDFSTPTYQAAFTSIEQAATRAGVLLGSRSHPGYPIERLLGAGHSFILASGDVAALRDGYRADLEAARGGEKIGNV
jgi:2-keto-3-deoxy-L-rhamnonate aldolase RhmA